MSAELFRFFKSVPLPVSSLVSRGTGVLFLFLVSAVLQAKPAWAVRAGEVDHSGFKAVGRVGMGSRFASLGATGFGFGTGTLIAPDLVITVGHVLRDGKMGKIMPARFYEFYNG